MIPTILFLCAVIVIALLWTVLGVSLDAKLRCFVVGCNNEYSSRHLLLTSEPLKTQRITFVCEGNAPPDLPKCIYVRTNHS